MVQLVSQEVDAVVKNMDSRHIYGCKMSETLNMTVRNRNQQRSLKSILKPMLHSEYLYYWKQLTLMG